MGVVEALLVWKEDSFSACLDWQIRCHNRADQRHLETSPSNWPTFHLNISL